MVTRRRPQFHWARQALSLRGMLAAIVSLSLVSTSAGQLQDWTVRLESLRVVDASEESGDEPYLIVIGFRSKLGQLHSTRVFSTGQLAEIGKDLGVNKEKPIPEKMGRVQFDAVKTLTIQDVAKGALLDFTGVLIVAMASDATPWSDVQELADKVKASLETELRLVIERASLSDLANPERMNEVMRESLKRFRARIEPGTNEAMRIWAASLADPDDLVDFRVWILLPLEQKAYQAMGPAKAGKVRISRLVDHRSEFLVSSDGAQWRVMARVESPMPAQGPIDITVQPRLYKLDGDWHSNLGPVRFNQNANQLAGSLRFSNGSVAILRGSLRGAKFEFTWGSRGTEWAAALSPPATMERAGMASITIACRAPKASSRCSASRSAPSNQQFSEN